MMMAIWNSTTTPMPGHADSPTFETSDWLCPMPGVKVVAQGVTIDCLNPDSLTNNLPLLKCCSGTVDNDNRAMCCTSLYSTLNEATYQKVEIDQTMWNLSYLHVFILLWALEWISYISYMITTGAFSEWYFAKWKDDDSDEKERGWEKDELSPYPMLSATYRTVRFHLGTCAVGACLMAIVQFLRMVLAYIEKQAHSPDGEPNHLQKILLKCAHVCLWCLQCIIDKINHTGFIVCGITGLPFCASSVKGLALLMANVLRAAVLTVVTKYLTMIGKVAIMMTSAGLCVLILIGHLEQAYEAVLFPVITVALFAYLVASLYMHILSVGIDTLFMCFLIDEELNKEGGHMRAHDDLKRIFNYNQEKKRKPSTTSAEKMPDAEEEIQMEHVASHQSAI